MKALIAANKEDYRCEVAALLRAEGIEVEFAHNSEEALRVLPGDFDLVVSNLPELAQDYRFRHTAGTEQIRPELPFILYSTSGADTHTDGERFAQNMGGNSHTTRGERDILARSIERITSVTQKGGPVSAKPTPTKQATRAEKGDKELEMLNQRIEQLEEANRNLTEALADLTDQKQEAEDSQRRYYDLYNFAPVGYATLNSDGHVLEANVTAARYLGVDRSYIIGKSLVERIAETDRPRLYKHIEDILNKGAALPCNLTLIGESRQAKRYVQLQSVRVQQEYGTPVCLSSISDQTEQKRIEEAQRFLSNVNTQLAESLDYERTLARLARLCIPYLADWCTVFMISEEGDIQRLATAHADPRKEQIALELQEKYPIGKNNPFAVPIARGEPVFAQIIDEPTLIATTTSSEHRRLVQDLGVCSMLIVPLITHGNILGAISLASTGEHPTYTAEDMVVAKEMARRAALSVENARLYKEAREAVKAREEFLSIASHELRTPLTSLTLQIQGLLRSSRTGDLRSVPTERVERRLEGAYEQIQRMTTLIGKLLDVSRIEVGRVELEKEKVDLAALVQEVLDRFEGELLMSDCELVFSIMERPLCYVDRFRTDQVITNLVSNAIKYGRGGRISVTVGIKGNRAYVSVKDQGIGIAPENQERIFERFERAATGSYVGMGLGLYISKQLVELLGGTISVDSMPDHGSTFRIELPIEATLAD